MHFQRVTINLFLRRRAIWFYDETICFLIESFSTVTSESPVFKTFAILKENYLMAQFSAVTQVHPFFLLSKMTIDLSVAALAL